MKIVRILFFIAFLIFMKQILFAQKINNDSLHIKNDTLEGYIDDFSCDNYNYYLTLFNAKSFWIPTKNQIFSFEVKLKEYINEDSIVKSTDFYKDVNLYLREYIAYIDQKNDSILYVILANVNDKERKEININKKVSFRLIKGGYWGVVKVLFDYKNDEILSLNHNGIE
jgi:hypothetical protein